MNKRSKRSTIVSPSMIGSHGSSRGFLTGFGTRRPIGGVTWIGWANAWDTAAWMTGMGLPIYDFLRNQGQRAHEALPHFASPGGDQLDPQAKLVRVEVPCVPAGFWEVAENRHRYLRWLGKELGFRRPEDWYRIQTRGYHRPARRASC